ncbi:serine hydrolase domain-containing protein [Micromonospora sp. NPDC023737]|uniref:serine hydrolase domain-containing protein n=1 Tax=unclassified Micromonospora TaxID=2617518 RepID=UPI0033D3303D
MLAAVAALLLPLAVAAPAAGDPTGDRSPDDLVGRAAEYLRQHKIDNRIPGLTYAIVRGDRVIGQNAWGVDGDGGSITPQTPFVLGSVSKSFTALAVMQLVEAGRVELDAPARRYVSWLRLADESVAARITVRQLLTHTSGLPDVVNRGLLDRFDNSPGGLTRTVRELATVAPTAPPGEAYQYSNANYMVLGALVEAVAGQSFGSYLRRHVLDPLGMTHAVTNEAEARTFGLPAGHRYYFGRPQRFDPPFDTAGLPHGYLAMSLDDLTHYAIAQLNGGRYGDASVLSPPGIAQLHTGQVTTDGGGRYGLGWRESVLDGPGDHIVWHAGATPHYFSHLLLIPESDLAVLVMSNVYGLSMDWPLASAAFNVARIMQGGEAVPGDPDPVLNRLLLGLVVVGALLLGLLIWTTVRILGRRRNRSRTARRRIIAGTAGWVVGCAALAVGALWALPAAFGGVGLAQAMLYAMDLAHTLIVIAGLAVGIAVVRLGAAVHELTRRG